MTSVEFERMLSARSTFKGFAGHEQDAPCLRDMVFDYFCGRYNDDQRANEATKAYLDDLSIKMLVR